MAKSSDSATGAPRQRGRGEAARIWVLGLTVALAGFLVASRFVKPAPPDTLVLATGNPSGAYHAFGQQLATALLRSGLLLELRTTAGSAENVALLRSGAVDLAFVQGGTVPPAALAPDAEGETLEGLASLYHEPLWIFVRRGVQPERLAQLAGQRIGIGPEGSGTRAVARELLALNGVAHGVGGTLFDERPGGEAAAALLAGELDAVFLVGAPRAGAVARLTAELGGRVELHSLHRALAYERNLPYLSAVTLREGVLDLARNLPAQDTRMLAPTASLVATAELHPALVSLLLTEAGGIFGKGDLLTGPDSFPSPQHMQVPLARAADKHFRSGPSLLYRLLPFRVAAVVDRLWILLLPLVTLLFPLFKVAPPLYRWRIRSRIYRWYKVLRLVDEDERHDADALAQRLARLDAIEHEIRALHVPATYGEELYNLRFHLERVRAAIEARGKVSKA